MFGALIYGSGGPGGGGGGAAAERKSSRCSGFLGGGLRAGECLGLEI